MLNTIFLSAALFTYAEREFNRQLRDALVSAGFSVLLPQEFQNPGNMEGLFTQCVEGVKKADLVLSVLEGCDVDSGVAFEMGLAWSLGKPIVALRTDFRQRGESCDAALNLMLHYAASKVVQDGEDPFRAAVKAARDVLK